MNLLTHKPFDLHDLALFQLVVRRRSFTRAATAAGLSQSAVTRQIQGMEQALGLELLKRTTRSVEPTPAGEFLLREGARLVGDAESILRRLREEYASAPREIRVEVSRSISLAYLPGFFHANLRKLSHVRYQVRYSRTDEILPRLEADELDLGVLCSPPKLPNSLAAVHRFSDVFALIAPTAAAAEFERAEGRTRQRAWLAAQPWLLFDSSTTTGVQLRSWIKRRGLKLSTLFELDSFDLIVNLVALGMGSSFVPARTLALYARKKGFQRIFLPEPFERELAVIIRRRATIPPHVSGFVSNILF